MDKVTNTQLLSFPDKQPQEKTVDLMHSTKISKPQFYGLHNLLIPSGSCTSFQCSAHVTVLLTIRDDRSFFHLDTCTLEKHVHRTALIGSIIDIWFSPKNIPHAVSKI